jgi:hypothetical protein
MVSLSAESLQLIQDRLGQTLPELVERYSQEEAPESIRMLLAIAHGSPWESGEGWFGPAKSRYG